MISDDPDVRPDGKCVQCRGSRNLKGRGKLHRDEAAGDPFCSTECCRLWHNAPVTSKISRTDTPRTSDPKQSGAVKHGTRRGFEFCACDLCRAAVGLDPSPAAMAGIA